MADILDDPPEFTDDELRAVLKRVGDDARTAAFAAGLPISVFSDGQLITLYPDGSASVVGPMNEEVQELENR